MASIERKDDAGRETDSSEEWDDNTTGIPEPVFHNFFPQDDTEMRTKNLEVFVSTNIMDMENVNENQGAFRQGNAASFVFMVAERLHLSHHTRFLALELLDRFMVKHIPFLYRTVITSQCSDGQKREDWIRMADQLENHVHLRAVSCCQLASKFISTEEAVQLPVAKAVLADLGYSYSKDTLHHSEQRILQTLDYHLAFLCPYDYILALLEVLDYNTGRETLPVSKYLSVSGQLLTLLYLRCDVIYNSVLEETSPNLTMWALKRLQADKVLTAVSLIATAAVISDPPHARLVRKELHRLGGVSERDVKIFVDVLLVEIRAHGQ